MDPHCGYPIVINLSICWSFCLSNINYPKHIFSQFSQTYLILHSVLVRVVEWPWTKFLGQRSNWQQISWEKSMTDNIFYPGTSLAQIYPNYACRYGVCSEFVCQLPRSFIADLCVKSLFRPFIPPPPVLLVLSALYYTSRMIAR